MTEPRNESAVALRREKRRQRRLLPRALLSLLPPVAALIIQSILWSLITPYVWFLFYPAVFLSSWIGGLRAGLIATAVSTASVLWFFVPPEHSFLKAPQQYFPAVVFFTMGALFGVVHDRLREANRRAAEALGESERANENLRKAIKGRRMFAALIENSSDFIGIADPSGKFIYVNPAGRRMVGLSADHPVENTQIPEYYPPNQRAFAANVIVESIVEKGHWQGETYFWNWKTEEAIPVSDKHFKIQDPDTGQMLGMGTITRDISDLRRARDELQKAKDEVTRLYEKAKELDELKTQFFASVSHELRTPLALILGPTERMLEAADTKEPARHDLEVIARNARTLLGHVNNLLDVAKLEAGRMKPEYAETDVSGLARFIAGHFEVLSKEKNIAFDIEGPDALSAQVDPEKVQRILLNLLSNAFKFTPPCGHIRLTVREAPDHVRFEIADSGPGIPADKREAAFERFRQLEGGATRRVGGTGLGLSIAREFTLLHGGSISVSESSEGGALFLVDLPLAAPAGAVVRRPTKGAFQATADVRQAVEELRAPCVAVAPASIAAERARVLVVEDNPEMNRFLCESLASDYRVATAFDGREGLRMATQLRPDLILTDIMMPEMSGDELVHAIRSCRELDRTAIVVLTAKADDELRTRLLRTGAQEYLTKPFSVEELRARVDNLIRGNKAIELEAQWASFVEQAPDGIFIADREGRYTEINSAGCRMLGYDREELIGKTIHDLIPDDGVEQLEREQAQLLHDKQLISEWVLRKKDGACLPVEVSAKILPDGRWQGLVRDISQRRRVEAALHASHADLVRAQSVADVGSWRLDVRHNVLEWSDQEHIIFGVAPGTPMTYEAFLACIHPDDRAYVDREWNAGLRGEPYDIEHRIIVNGEVRWVREKADLEFDENHALVGGIGVTLDITDRKRREEELCRAQERLELALGGADLALWDWDITSGEVFFNPRWAEMRGYRPEEIRGHVDTWISGVHPEDWPRVKQVLEEHFQGQRSEYETEHRARTKSGQWIWVLDRGKVFARNERGEPVRMAGTELDITARKQSQEALRIAEAKSTGIVSIAADAIISIDKEQRITLFNEGAEKIFGYEKAEVVGAPLSILIPERLRATHRQHLEKFAAGENVSRRMCEYGGPQVFGLRKNGEEFPADAAMSKLEVEGERILTVVLRDITEQKRIEREQKFLAEVGPVLATTLDYQETLSKIAELAVRDLADLCIVDIVEADGAVRRLKVLAREPAKAWVAEALMRSPLDRKRIHLCWSALETKEPALIADVTSEMVASWGQNDEQQGALRGLGAKSAMTVPLVARRGLLGVLAFVSSTRAYGPADLDLAVELAYRAALSIENAQLYLAAKRASQVRDEVLGIVAHDLRNPLYAIVSQASRLRRNDGEAEGQYRKSVEAIERAANRMNRLIQDLLDVTCIEAGRLSIEKGRMHAAQVVIDAVEAQRSLASSASLELQTNLSPDLPDVRADRDRLLQVFENLLGNAMKFTEPGGRITVGAASRDGEALFWVADTGSGIPAENVPHLFERFWQGRKLQRGAGLGLPIVKGIVEAHGGRIWVESTPGRGSTFFFTIPTAHRA